MTYVDELAAYAWYFNTLPRAEEHFEPDALEQFKQDMSKAKAAMERAYLDLIPTEDDMKEITPPVTLDTEQARALAAYISKRGFDFEESATIGVILEKCRAANESR